MSKVSKPDYYLRAFIAAMILAPASYAAITVASAASVPISTVSAPAPAAEVVDIKIDNFSFGPQTVTVAAGTQVRWTNHDDIPHNTVGEDKSFKSTTLDTDQQFTHTFDKAGTYKYYCSIHPRMTGTVVVQ
jgi:plastocyanin